MLHLSSSDWSYVMGLVFFISISEIGIDFCSFFHTSYFVIQLRSPDTPIPAAAKSPSLVSKIILKISPKHKADPASAPHPNRHAHLTSNGKLPSSRSEPSLSERLLVRTARQRRSPGRYKDSRLELPGGRLGSRGEVGSRRLASEQALELDEFEPSSPGGVYSVQDGRIRTHGR